MGLHFEHLAISTVDAPEGLVRFWWDLQELPYSATGPIHPDVHGGTEARPPHPFFSVTPDSTVEAEVHRVVALGATVLAKHHHGWGIGHVDLADPAGNLFTIESAEPPDVETVIEGPRETTAPFWSDAAEPWRDADRWSPVCASITYEHPDPAT